MLFVATDSKFDIHGVYSNSTKAFKNKPHNGFVVLVPSGCDKSFINGMIERRVKSGSIKSLVATE